MDRPEQVAGLAQGHERMEDHSAPATAVGALDAAVLGAAVLGAVVLGVVALAAAAPVELQSSHILVGHGHLSNYDAVAEEVVPLPMPQLACQPWNLDAADPKIVDVEAGGVDYS